MLGDLLVLSLAGIVAVSTQYILNTIIDQTPAAFMYQLLWLTVLVVTWLSFAVVTNSYDLLRASKRKYSVLSILVCVFGTGIIYSMIFFVLGRPILFGSVEISLPLPRLTAILFLIIAPILLVSWRFSYIALFSSMPLRRRAIVLGTGEAGHALVQVIHRQMPHYTITGFVSDTETTDTELDGTPILGHYRDLSRLIRQSGVTEIILAVPRDLSPDMLTTLMHCYEQGITIKPMNLLYEDLTGRVPVQHSRRWWFPVPTWSSATSPTLRDGFKRMLDIVAALVGMVGLVILFPFVALAIYLNDPGPIFYRQERTGRRGQSFYLLKFRSMITDAEKYGKAVWATQDDPRITRVGKFLRLTRIDELPQIWNVLKGDMSIVGPRPERPVFIAQLQEEIPFYRMRLSVKPGLTGWAQINYRYGSTVEDAIKKLEYDLYYIKHQSLLLDVLIILRTIKVVLLFRGQ
jgi:exopolysaccharide biosynthesis polyprenyl glycosylphosphotransferase